MQFSVAFFFFFQCVFLCSALSSLLASSFFHFFLFLFFPLILHPLSDCVASLLNCTLCRLIQSTGFLNDALPCTSCTKESGPVSDTSASGSFACWTAAGARADQLAPTHKSGKLTDKKAVILFPIAEQPSVELLGAAALSTRLLPTLPRRSLH